MPEDKFTAEEIKKKATEYHNGIGKKKSAWRGFIEGAEWMQTHNSQVLEEVKKEVRKIHYCIDDNTTGSYINRKEVLSIIDKYLK